MIPKRYRDARNILLLVFSLFFYSYGGPKFLILITISIIANYICGLFVSQGHTKMVRRFFCVAAIAFGLGLLGWFKYSAFFAETLKHIYTGLPVPEVTLPIGISFYTFQGLSYVIDVYRGDAPVQKNPLKVALYISLFPQLVAGPIVRYVTISAEVDNRRENLTDFTDGAMRFVFGLSKKMLLANTLGAVSDKIFSNSPGNISVSLAWLGIFAYTAQIYFDFSAYSDMALGLGKMFGFHFLENFNYPYISKSITEFWRRWHISLSSWFRDYVYIPLGGNRCTSLKHIANIIVVWLLTGLWHGAAWNFVAWGLWFCLLLLGEKYIWGKLLAKTPSIIAHAYTLLMVMLSWVLFRSESFIYAVEYIGAMFGIYGRTFSDGQTVYYLLQYWPELILAVIASMPVKNALLKQKEKYSGKPMINVLYLWGPRLIALGLLVLSYMKLVTGSFNPFIYFRF